VVLVLALQRAAGEARTGRLRHHAGVEALRQGVQVAVLGRDGEAGDGADREGGARDALIGEAGLGGTRAQRDRRAAAIHAELVLLAPHVADTAAHIGDEPRHARDAEVVQEVAHHAVGAVGAAGAVAQDGAGKAADLFQLILAIGAFDLGAQP
jgi:hypothetical protein